MNGALKIEAKLSLLALALAACGGRAVVGSAQRPLDMPEGTSIPAGMAVGDQVVFSEPGEIKVIPVQENSAAKIIPHYPGETWDSSIFVINQDGSSQTIYKSSITLGTTKPISENVDVLSAAMAFFQAGAKIKIVDYQKELLKWKDGGYTIGANDIFRLNAGLFAALQAEALLGQADFDHDTEGLQIDQHTWDKIFAAASYIGAKSAAVFFLSFTIPEETLKQYQDFMKTALPGADEKTGSLETAEELYYLREYLVQMGIAGMPLEK